MKRPSRLVRTLVLLTFTTGLIDAASYLGLGQVFTANMTGNIVFLGFGLAGRGGLPVVAPLVSLAAFLLGAGLGGRLATPAGDPDLGRALEIEVALLAAAAVFAAAVGVHPRAASGDAVVALLALAMGVRNATVRRLGVPDLTTTVLTMTLTGLAADRRPTARRTAAVLAMLAGALAGALLLEAGLAAPLAVAAALALAATLSR
jgi:uncharacterized membrane protein YoaK (UPF0700 family)